MEFAQKLLINKKSTMFFKSSQNLMKMIIKYGNYFQEVTKGLDKNCGFFINGQFLNLSRFSLLRLYLHTNKAKDRNKLQRLKKTKIDLNRRKTTSTKSAL